VVTIELQGQLLAWEWELDRWERVLMAQEDGLVALERDKLRRDSCTASILLMAWESSSGGPPDGTGE
jgi:hypothetical protein